MPTLAAYDLGSGATKLVVADVDAAGRVTRVHHEEEAEVLLGATLRRDVARPEAREAAPADALDPATVARLFTVLARFRAIAASWDASESLGVGTAVYRMTTNGAAVLGEIRRRFGLRVLLLSQDEEAAMGFATGRALWLRTASSSPLPAEIVVWDSGGASFQLSAGPLAAAVDAAPVRQVACGRWGSSTTLAALQRHLGIPREQSPNPLASSSFAPFVEQLTERIRQDFPPRDAAALRGRAVVAIGGGTNAFFIATLVLKREKAIFRSDVLRAAATLCGKTDAEVSVLGIPQPEIACSKLALVAAVMAAYDLASFDFVRATGLCFGLLSSLPFWNERSRL